MRIEFDYPWPIRAWMATKPYMLKGITFLLALACVFLMGLFLWTIIDKHLDWNDKYNTAAEYGMTYVSSKDGKEKTVRFKAPAKDIYLNMNQLWHQLVFCEGKAVSNFGDTTFFTIKRFEDVKEVKKFVRFKQSTKNDKNHGKNTAKKK